MNEGSPNKTTTHVVVTSGKSLGAAILLTIFFGPLGLFYASIRGALILIFGAPLVAALLFVTGAAQAHNSHDGGLGSVGLGIAVIAAVYPASIVWSVIATNAYNKKLMARLAA